MFEALESFSGTSPILNKKNLNGIKLDNISYIDGLEQEVTALSNTAYELSALRVTIEHMGIDRSLVQHLSQFISLENFSVLNIPSLEDFSNDNKKLYSYKSKEARLACEGIGEKIKETLSAWGEKITSFFKGIKDAFVNFGTMVKGWFTKTRERLDLPESESETAAAEEYTKQDQAGEAAAESVKETVQETAKKLKAPVVAILKPLGSIKNIGVYMTKHPIEGYFHLSLYVGTMGTVISAITTAMFALAITPISVITAAIGLATTLFFSKLSLVIGQSVIHITANIIRSFANRAEAGFDDAHNKFHASHPGTSEPSDASEKTSLWSKITNFFKSIWDFFKNGVMKLFNYTKTLFDGVSKVDPETLSEDTQVVTGFKTQA